MRRTATNRHKAPGRRFETGEMRARIRPAHTVDDELGDTLVVIKEQLKSAIQAEAGSPPANGAKADSGSAQADCAGLSIRQISAELVPVLLDMLGLAATIEWYTVEFQRCTGIDCDLSIDDTLGTGLDLEYGTAIFHICREALSNVAHHARAERVAITVSITPQEVAMVVSDNGLGITEMQACNPTPGGIAEIRKRAGSHQGFCRVVGVPNKGTTLSVSLPLAGAGGRIVEFIATGNNGSSCLH